MPPLRESLARLRFAAIACVVSVFPERTKRLGWPSAYASVAAHVVSGWLEAVTAVALFVPSLLSYAERFDDTVGWRYVSSRPTLTHGDFFGVGVIGYLSFLLTPVAWITVWCFGEGIVRALDAAISRRLLGMAMVALPWRAAAALARRRARLRLLAMLGPERPDEVEAGEPGSRAALVVYTGREKRWSENQVVEFRGGFFALARRHLVRRGDHHAYRYDFRPLEPGEVILGRLVRIDLETASEGRNAPAGDGDRQATGP